MWTKSQKVSAGVLGLAVVAFLGDRFILPAPDAGGSKPATSEYAVNRTAGTGSPSSSSAAASPTTAANTATALSVTTLAGRLAAVGESRRLAYQPAGDAFRPADAWLAALLPPPPPKPDAATAAGPKTVVKKAAKPKVDYAAQFRAGHNLTAVMNVAGGGMAIVNGKIYAPGQAVGNGFRLTKVGLTQATFSGRGTTVTLRLPGLPPAGAGTAVAHAR